MIDFKKLYEHVHERDNALKYADALLEPDNQNRRGQSPDPRRMGWICPVCGNGSGEDGDGIKYNVNDANPGHFKCFRCDAHGDIVDVVGWKYNITDNVEKARKTIEALGLESEVPGILGLDPGQSGKLRGKSGSTNTALMGDSARREPEGKPDVNSGAKEALELLREALDMGAWESSEVFSEAKSMADLALRALRTRGIEPGNPLLAYVGAFRNEKIGSLTFESCYAFFGSPRSFSARDMNPDAERKASKPTGVPDVPFGLLSVIMEPEKRLTGTNTPEPVFVCEGAVDALSLAQAGADAVALNGTGGVDILLRAFEEFGVRRPVVLAMDDDEAGRKARSRIAKTLKESGIEFSLLDPIPDDLEERGIKDPNDLLLADKALFKERVKKARHFKVNEFKRSFNENKEEWLREKFRELVERGAIKTGFETLDGPGFLDGGLYPGLYIIGSVSAAGKTTFTLKMANQIATAGTDVIFYSLETPDYEVMSKSISRYTLTNLIEAGKLTPGEKADDRAKSLRDVQREFGANGDVIDAMGRYFADTGKHMRIVEGTGNVSVLDIAHLVEEHIKLSGRRPVVFIDYLQLLVQPADMPGVMTDKQKVDANVFRLKQISRDLDIPIIGISSFNRDNYNNPVNMTSFKESGAIEYSSDVLIGLEPAYMGVETKPGPNGADRRDTAKKRYESHEKKTGIRDMRLVILKNRNGEKDGVAHFSFYSENGCFLEDQDGNVESRYKKAS